MKFRSMAPFKLVIALLAGTASGTYVAKLTKHFQLVHFKISAGHVFLFPSSPETVSCGEVKTILCYADRTTKVTVAARHPTVSFGSHTYQRNSPPLAKVGPVELNLTDVVVSPVKDSLSNFNVTASERTNGTIIIITCTDVYNSSEVQIMTFSKSENSHSCSDLALFTR